MSDTININTQKENLRTEAKRARALLSLNINEQEQLCAFFFEKIKPAPDKIIAVYWPKGRELDTHIIIDHCLEKDLPVALPIVEKSTRLLKFVLWDEGIELEKGAFGIMQPSQDKNTIYVEPDIFLVPLLAFDRSGYRLGYGGGYYDTTLSHYKAQKEIISVGLAYAQQACLFNLPRDEHDMKLDWVITEQSAQKY